MGTNPGNLGYADYLYRQDQPATTLWYHDHSLGMTRSNVYAGPAGFWLIRGGLNDLAVGVLPGPAPTAGDTVLELNAPSLGPAGTTDKRSGIREIPVVIQDRSFEPGGGQLFYQGNRAFFEGLNPTGGAAPTLEIPFAPKAALLGQVDLTGPVPIGIPLLWTDTTSASTPKNVTMADGPVRSVNVTENPIAGDTEEWDIYNFTVDGHPIHLHLVRFEVVSRRLIGAAPVAPGVGVQPWETGYKDTVIAYPGEITQVKALFDLAGLYVWHCHIVEHEDNEMMRPYVVSQ
jgi:FtsP/CotA-like multicopper oxidase with cupredoxin domain